MRDPAKASAAPRGLHDTHAAAELSASPEAKPDKANEQKPNKAQKAPVYKGDQPVQTLLTNSNATPKKVLSESADTSEFLKVLKAKLKEAIGPMAPLVITDHIRALGESSESFPNAKLEELTKRISKEIANDSHRIRFEEEMSAEIKKNAAARVSSEANEMRSSAAASKPAAAVKNGLPAGFLDRVRTKLEEAMGPMAALVLSDQIRALGESFDSFPEAKFDELTKRVSEEIFDEYHRTRFANEIKNLGAEYERT